MRALEWLEGLYRKYREIISYVIAGVATTIVSLGIYYVSVLTFLDPGAALQLQAANVLSWTGAVAFAYVVNRRFVFRNTDTHRLAQAAKFVASRLSTLLMDMAVMFIMVTVLGGNDKIAKLVSQVVVMVGNYLLSKFFVFRKKT